MMCQRYSMCCRDDGPGPSCRFNQQSVMRGDSAAVACFLCQTNLNKPSPPFKEKVIAYATEAVFGLGCDPDSEAAVQRLLAIKQRPVEKG